jgi:hypothetical protein
MKTSLVILLSPFLAAKGFVLSPNSSSSGRQQLTVFCSHPDDISVEEPSRRMFLAFAGVVAATSILPVQSAEARYVLDDETGDYVEIAEVDWQTEWKARMDKASSMSNDEIFQAARGAGNIELREGQESEASKKRRAMSACRDAGVRAKAQAGAEKECTARVFGGEVDFLLNAL